ncbi:MAG TPA: hypothetical protein VKR56_11115 [Candidatus Cybelea sp.]|nr:hypothetical protein [Candidatus Cybelea sp.]
MVRSRVFLAAFCAGWLLGGCGSASLKPQPGLIAATAPGNISWNKPGLRLKTDGTHGQAILTYWGPDGYYTEPVYCKNGGRISANTHGRSGKRTGYVRVVYWFKALTHSPDQCGFSAVLNNTGSPPIAVIELRIL